MSLNWQDQDFEYEARRYRNEMRQINHAFWRWVAVLLVVTGIIVIAIEATR